MKIVSALLGLLVFVAVTMFGMLGLILALAYAGERIYLILKGRKE